MRASAILPLFFLVLLTVVFLPHVHADELIVLTNKPSYSLGATIDVYGTLTLTGVPVTDGLVAVQVDDNLENTRMIRVVSTGTLPAPWKVRIVEFMSCDADGNPKSSFNRGDLACFRVTVESLAVIPRQVTVALNLFDSIGDSIAITFTSFSMDPGDQYTFGPTSLPIPNHAFVGTGICYVSVLTDWPKNCGKPYCPEESVDVEITDGSSQATGSPLELTASSPGSYNLSFKLPSSAMLGKYSVIASARGNALAVTDFDYFWRYTDVNRDGRVNILDISASAILFGSRLGDPNYNSLADIQKDNIINILDIAAVALDYGKART